MKNSADYSIATKPSASQVISKINGYTVEVCCGRKSLNAAFRVRYRAYLDVGAIPANDEGLLYDEFDFLPNSFIHLVWYNGKPVATIRSCIFSDTYDWSNTEAANYFQKDIRNRFGFKTRHLESSRFAVDPDFQGRQSMFAQLLLFRAHGLNAFSHNVTQIITAVRSNHIPFYKRFLGMEQISFNSKYVAWADADVVLMSVSVEKCGDLAMRRGIPEIHPIQVESYASRAGITQDDMSHYRRA